MAEKHWEAIRSSHEIVKQDIFELGESSSKKWSLWRKDSTVEVKSLTKKGIPVTLFKATGRLPMTGKQILQDLFLSQDRRLEWNPSFKEQNIVDQAEIDGHHYTTYREAQNAAMGGMVSARDFIEVRDWFEEENGNIWFIYQSADLPEWPPQHGFVRGKIHPSGYLLEPDKDNKDHCIVHFTSHIDVSGSLPVWMVSKGIAAEMAKFFDRVSTMYKK